MTFTVHLGVAVMPYSHTETVSGKRGRKKGTPPVEYTQTTGDVAEKLEDKYGIMDFFWKNHQQEIVTALEGAIEGAFESVMMGAPTPSQPLAEGTSKVENLFQKMLSEKELDGRVGGVPTAASLGGVSHRFKKKNSGVTRTVIH